MEVLRLPAVPRDREKISFWRRQFATEIRTPQIVFDVLLGAVGPVFCFIFDPIVFHRGFAGAPLFPEYQTFTYLFSTAQVAVLCLWLIFKPRNEFCRSMIAAALIAGAFFCMIVACLLAPFSLMGLMFGIGIFGFTPFLTTFVYLRNSVRAFRSGATQSTSATLSAMTIGLLLALSPPVVLTLGIRAAVTNAVDEVIHGDPRRADFAAHRLISLRFFAESELDGIVNAYLSEQNPQRREQLKKLYREITGDDIYERARILRD